MFKRYNISPVILAIKLFLFETLIIESFCNELRQKAYECSPLMATIIWNANSI